MESTCVNVIVLDLKALQIFFFFFFDSLGDAKYDGYVLFQANKQQWPLNSFQYKIISIGRW